MRSRHGHRLVPIVVAGALALAACSDGDRAAPDSSTNTTTSATAPAATDPAPSTDAPASTAPAEPDGYAATIRRTTGGVPHIEADDYGSLGFGYGYAFAEDHLCSLADAVVQVRSEAAGFHGPGPDDKWLNQDLVYRALDLYERARVDLDGTDPDLRAVIVGYAAGYNRYLADVGADAVPGYCAGQPWVRPIDEYDLAAYYKALSWRASVDPLMTYIATAEPPLTGGATTGPTTDSTVAGAAFAGLTPEPTALASNAWAIGPDRTEEGTTMIMGNPHFPWQGMLRFYEVHLTIPDTLDVYGASLLGSPAVQIGFTPGVAWSHTVSAGSRFTAYQLDLVPGDPTSYAYGDEQRAMTSRDVSVEVRAEDGSSTTVTRTFWFTHYGPVINFPGLGWTEATTLTFRDANADNDELLPQFFAMNHATDMDDLIEAHATWQGIPWVNTVAASADGRIWYADASATPNLSDEAIAAWEEAVATDPITKIALDNRVVLLDGSDPRFEWVDDPAARDPGVVPFGEVPQLERTDVVFNANDPYWLANPDELLTGYSPLHGLAEQPVSNRTRMNAVQLDAERGDAGADGQFSFEELSASAVSNRVFTAEALVDEVVERCRAATTAPGLPEVCDVLASWDRRVDADSVGAALWREFIDSYSGAELVDAGPLWAEPFDPADPVGTPRGLSADASIVDRLLAAAAKLGEAGFGIATPLGEIQFADRAGERVPIHGGTQSEGVTNVVGFGTNTTTTETGVERGDRIEGSRSLTTLGYPVANGTSFMYALEFRDGGPVAHAFLTYGQSGDPAAPVFAGATRAFAAKQWRPLLVDAADIAADPELREYRVEE